MLEPFELRLQKPSPHPVQSEVLTGKSHSSKKAVESKQGSAQEFVKLAD
jgi:hypothetical protein